MIAARRASRRTARARVEVPNLIELIVIGVRSGLSPTAAFTSAATRAGDEIAPALAEVTHRLRRGERLAEALTALPAELGPAAVSFADAFTTAERYGLPIEPVLDQVATDVRLERSRQAQANARTLPVRLAFPLVICTLPSFVLLAIAPALLGALSTLHGSTP